MSPTDITTPTPQRRSFSPTPAWLVLGSLAVTGLLFVSERFQWFWFNEKKGWTVLVAVARVGVVMLLMLIWFVGALMFRWRFQFSIRLLLVLVVAVAAPCSWPKLAASLRQRKAEAHPNSLPHSKRRHRRHGTKASHRRLGKCDGGDAIIP